MWILKPKALAPHELGVHAELTSLIGYSDFSRNTFIFSTLTVEFLSLVTSWGLSRVKEGNTLGSLKVGEWDLELNTVGTGV